MGSITAMEGESIEPHELLSRASAASDVTGAVIPSAVVAAASVTVVSSDF